ncbi:translocation/assembly module TamB domain-containing protein [Arcicella sp. LKC2W]|uniref:translocation/assembly module TamB domain-containing protein n=1 Tax=Arcicella sp. LKC2W TaxID=2984198 RepID=UPI002B1F936B|nr:translocation/assembly module TamB domain-containing protein [Arcicella sp. LKC2W]MEA5461599.1 translocation/assembly module TamB domain-containing protein [Arcicella sp. LKC2W]
MRQFFKITGIILLALVLLVVGLFFYLQTSAGQNFLTQRVTSYLKSKIDKPFSIKKISYKIPDWIALEGVYFSDNQGDTLIDGQKLYVNMDMLGLLKNQVSINEINLENININIKRTLPDTTFNFAYILKSFETPNTNTKIDTAKGIPLKYKISNIKLKNVRVKYLDDVTGVDAKVYLSNTQTSFSDFDPATSKYHLHKLALDGGNMNLRLFASIPSTKKVENTPSDTLDFSFTEFDAKNINWKITEETSGLVNSVKLGRLNTKASQVYLSGEKIHLKSVDLYNTDASVTFLRKKSIQKTGNPTSAAQPNNWKVSVDKIIFDKNNITYQDQNQPLQKKGIDYNNLKINNLKLNLERLYYSENKTSGWIYSGSFKEKSGFELQNLQADFAYTNRQTFLKKLLFKTPQSILRDEFVLNYNSFNELTDNIGKVRIKSNIKNSQLAFKDILLLAPDLAETPPFKGNEKEVLKFNGGISGTINNMKVSQFTMTGFDQVKLNIQGQITGLPDVNKTVLNLNVQELSITKKDLLKIAPQGSVPDNIELPQKVVVLGKISGKLDNLVLNTNLKSDLGNASFNGKLINITADKNQQYDGKLAFENFEMGKFLKQTEKIGKITLLADVKGTGIDPKTMKASINGTIQQAELQGYNYKNVIIQANLANQIAELKGNIKDSNISLDIDSKFDISQPFPTIKGNVKVTELNLKALGFYADNIGIRGDIDVDMQNTNPDNPSGTITINQGTLLQDGKPIKIENTTLTASNTAEGKKITIDAPFVKANLKGNFNYLQISDIIVGTINRYFVIPDVAYKPILTPYNLSIDAKFVKHPVLQAFVPALTRLDTSRFTASIDSQADTIFRANLTLPYLEYDTIQVSKVKFAMTGNAQNLTYNGGLDGVNFTGFKVRKTSLTGDINNNTASFKATFKDSVEKDRHQVVGLVQNIDNQYQIKFKKDGLLLNYASWNVDSTGYIQYGKSGLLVNHFNIERGIQKLSVNSTTSTPNGPIDISADSLNIQNFVTLFVPDSTLAGGKIDGKILLSNYMESPSFTGDVLVTNFRFQKTPIGNLQVNVFNETANKITAKASLLNQYNDIQLAGNYYLNTKNSLDLNLIINKLAAETVEAFSFGQLRRAKGNLNGQASIKGSTDNPFLKGNLNFSKVAFDVSQLGSRYLIDEQNLIFDGQTIRLKQFTVSDTLNQPLKVDGTVVLSNIPSVKYDLTIDTKNFMVLNSTRKDNGFFYGKGFVDANLSLQGVSEKAKIEGDIKVRENSKISVVVPDSFDELSESEGVVVFVNHKNHAEKIKADSLQQQRFINDFVSEISLNIEADEKSEFTIVVDEINGDNLVVKGNARLNAGVTADGQPYILGSYDLTEGKYGLTFEVIKKQFSIQKGSNIVWTGDPMNAEVNITAIYTANTAPLDLMENSVTENSALYRQKMNFDVFLTMAGKLSKPDVSFQIKASETQRLISSDVITNVKDRLAKLEMNETNKQVFALLILNRFFSEKSSDFFSTSSGGVNAEAFARQSVSKLLSDQLDRFASDLIKGVNLDVNLSSTQDFFNGEASSRTDLSLGLSKAFFNDKIEVKVGRNFELENTSKISRNPAEVFDNINVNYKLTNDGRYLFKAFRKNQFQSVLEGFIVETGIGFTITMEYGKFNEVFQKKQKTN